MLKIHTAVAQSATLEKISAFEQQHHLSLPSTYKDFLLSTNGGRSDVGIFKLNGPNGATEWMIETFFGIGAFNEFSDLSTAKNVYSGAMPDGVLPIGNDGMANYICLDLRNGSDRVVLWDKRNFWGTGIWSDDDLYFIATSFYDFINSL